MCLPQLFIKALLIIIDPPQLFIEVPLKTLPKFILSFTRYLCGNSKIKNHTMYYARHHEIVMFDGIPSMDPPQTLHGPSTDPQRTLHRPSTDPPQTLNGPSNKKALFVSTCQQEL